MTGFSFFSTKPKCISPNDLRYTKIFFALKTKLLTFAVQSPQEARLRFFNSWVDLFIFIVRYTPSRLFPFSFCYLFSRTLKCAWHAYTQPFSNARGNVCIQIHQIPKERIKCHVKQERYMFPSLPNMSHVKPIVCPVCFTV